MNNSLIQETFQAFRTEWEVMVTPKKKTSKLEISLPLCELSLKVFRNMEQVPLILTSSVKASIELLL